MGPLILAWGLGMGIITWRSVRTDKPPHPPVPGQMLAATGLFALLALVAEYEPARRAAIAFAYGVDIAVLMKVLPGTGGAPKAAAKVTEAPGHEKTAGGNA